MRMKLSVLMALALAAALRAGDALAGPTEEISLQQVPVQKIVVFRDAGMDWSQREAMIRKAGGEPVRRLPLIEAVVGSFPKGMKFDLQNDPHITFVADDGYAKMIGAAPISRRRPQTSAQRMPWGIDRVGAPSAWSRASGSGVKVCIVDSGVDIKHPDLAANVKGGADFSGAASGGADYNDVLGHGSHVNGIIAAVNNDDGVVGVAPNAELYQARVFGASGSTGWSNVIAGIDYCTSMKAHVINMSLGGGHNSAMQMAVRKAYEAGLVIVAAAGNDYGNAVGFPAAYPEVIAVSASNNSDGFAPFSSAGPEVDLIAPGQSIFSTYYRGRYSELSGTSMASPHVAGAAALVLSAKPELTNAQVKEVLERSAKNIGLPAKQQGKGLLNAAGAVSSALAGVNPGTYVLAPMSAPQQPVLHPSSAFPASTERSGALLKGIFGN